LKEARPMNVLRYINLENAAARAHYCLVGYTTRTPKWRQFMHLSTLVLVHNYAEMSYKRSMFYFIIVINIILYYYSV
jgi:hypothetical protein